MENNYDCSYWLLLPTGLAIALVLWLMTLYMRTILSQREWTKRVLSERTAELHEHEQHLERLIEERTESLSRKTSFLEALADTSAEGILVVDGEGRRLFQNKRYAELWRAPHDLLDRKDEEAWTRHVLRMVKDPGLFRMGEERLFAHPDDTFCDEVDLIDERVLERYSCPLVGDDGRPHERVLRFREITEQRRVEEALRESENKFRDLAEKSIVGIYLIQDGMFRYVNSRFAEIHGYTPEELIDRKGIEETAVREDMAGVQENIRKRISGELDLVRGEFRIVTKQGETKDVEIYGSHTMYRGRKAVIGTLLDVTERKQTESMLRWKTAFLEAQVNSSLDGILAIDNQGRHILQNQRTADIWKVPQHILCDRDDSRRFDYMVSMTKHEGQFRQKVDYLMRHPNETSRDEIELRNGMVLDTYSCPVRGEEGKSYGRIWTFRDITEIRRYWDTLESLSATDGLTDLANRRRFDDFLGREWRRSMRDQTLLSLVLLDIDFFKEFNDHYGHLAGDDCLRQVARILQEATQRPGDLAARYGGEEFACILPDTDSPGAVAMANRIREQVNAAGIPHFFSSVADHITVSFGVATLVPSTRRIAFEFDSTGRQVTLLGQAKRSRSNQKLAAAFEGQKDQ